MAGMRRRRTNLICLFLTLTFLIFLWNCSTSSRRPSETTRLNLREMEPREMTQFFRNVRSPGGNPEAHYLLACYYQERERHREAIAEFEKVLLIDPRYVKAYSGMGISYGLLKDHVRTIECYKNALELEPKLDHVQNNLGYAYFLQGNHEEAISAFQRTIALNGKENRFHNNLGLAYATSGQLEKALEEFKLGGEASMAHFNVAQFYYRKGLFQLARFHYCAALTLDPSFTHARIALRAVDALVRILQPEALTMEDQQEPKSEPFAFGPMESERSASPVPLVTSDTPPVSENPHRTERDYDARAGSRAVDFQGRMVPAEAHDAGGKAESTLKDELSAGAVTDKFSPPFSIEKPESRVETSPLHGSRPREKDSLAPKRFGIEVSNGNGARGMAKAVGQYLKTRGLEVDRITNANHFNYPVSTIYYQEGYQEAASLLAGQLSALDAMKEIKRFDRTDIKVRLLLGKDLMAHQRFMGKE